MRPRPATSSSWTSSARSTASAFEGGKGEDMSVELGSGRLIPGFEDQLVGVKAGDKREVNVTFPDDYPVENLKGKDATFDVTVKAVKTAGETQDRRRIRQVARPREPRPAQGPDPRSDRAGAERPHPHAHEAPAARPARRAAMISRCRRRWSRPSSEHLAQLQHEASHEDDPEAALAEIEKRGATIIASIAERRVRLGLLLSEIGAANGVEVSEQEMKPADRAGRAAISGQGPRALRPVRPAGADGRRPAARAAVRGQGRRLPVRARPRSPTAR